MTVTAAIDWYSFTIPGLKNTWGDESCISHIHRVMAYSLDYQTYNAIFAGDGWESRSGRRPYQSGLSKDGVYIWYGGQNTALVELSGTGCEMLRGVDMGQAGNGVDNLLAMTHERATRLDVAIDIETATRPADFVAKGYNGRIKSKAFIESSSGETVYIGSKKGDRYCRVYRYDNQHKRSHLLRIETVSRRGYAKTAAKFHGYYGTAHIAQMTLNYFKFQSEETPTMANIKETIALPQRETSDDKRVKWLRDQVAPAVRDMIQRGVITSDEVADMFKVEQFQAKLFILPDDEDSGY